MEILVTTHEAARRLGIGRTTLFNLLKCDRLKAVRLGKKTLLPTAELERFAASLPARDTNEASEPGLEGGHRG